MTTITSGTTVQRQAANPERRLRTVLAANAATSLLTGAVGLTAAPWLSDELGIDSTLWTRIVSAFLVVFAVDVFLVARARPGQLHRWTAAVSAADLAWVAATAVVVAIGALNGTGVAVAVITGIAVLDFALLQLWLRQKMV